MFGNGMSTTTTTTMIVTGRSDTTDGCVQCTVFGMIPSTVTSTITIRTTQW